MRGKNRRMKYKSAFWHVKYWISTLQSGITHNRVARVTRESPIFSELEVPRVFANSLAHHAQKYSTGAHIYIYIYKCKISFESPKRPSTFRNALPFASRVTDTPIRFQSPAERSSIFSVVVSRFTLSACFPTIRFRPFRPPSRFPAVFPDSQATLPSLDYYIPRRSSQRRRCTWRTVGRAAR